MELGFVSSNEYKIKETQIIFADSGIKIRPYNIKIEEIQTLDVEKLVKDKLLKAFSIIGRPLFVEHTGLYIPALNNFPGGLTQIFWDSLQADLFARIIGNLDNPAARAITTIGYCDGKKIYICKGYIDGIIAKEPRGNKDFQWDCVFIPKGENKTFSEMGDEKNNISMRKLAFEELKKIILR